MEKGYRHERCMSQLHWMTGSNVITRFVKRKNPDGTTFIKEERMCRECTNARQRERHKKKSFGMGHIYRRMIGLPLNLKSGLRLGQFWITEPWV